MNVFGLRDQLIRDYTDYIQSFIQIQDLSIGQYVRGALIPVSCGRRPEQATDFLRKVVEGFEYLRSPLDEAARQHSMELLDAHTLVRDAARLKGVRYRVEPQLPPDALGLYIYLPAPK